MRNKIFQITLTNNHAYYVKAIDKPAVRNLLQQFGMCVREIIFAPGNSKEALTPFEVKLAEQDSNPFHLKSSLHQSRDTKYIHGMLNDIADNILELLDEYEDNGIKEHNSIEAIFDHILDEVEANLEKKD